MAANFEEIFRSFVVNKFKEIQGETMSSETCETQMNGGEIQPVVTEIPTEGAVVCVQSVQNEHIVQKIEGVHSETVDTEPQPSSDLKLNLPVNKREPSDVLPEEVRNESPRKKSKKHKKHKSKKKKKRKKEKKERQKLKSLITECQGNVESERVSLSPSPHVHTAEITEESRSNTVFLDTRTIESETSRLVVQSESDSVLNFDQGSQTKTAPLEEFGPHNVSFKETTLRLQEPNGTDLRSGETLHSANIKIETVHATSCTVPNTDFEVMCKHTDTEQTLRSKGSEPSRFQNTDSVTVVTKSGSDLMVLNTDTNLTVAENTDSTALKNSYQNQTVIDPCLSKLKSEVSDGTVDNNPGFQQTEIQTTDLALTAVLNPDTHRTVANPDLAEVKHLDSYLTEGQDMDVEVVVETNMDCNLTQLNAGTDLLPVLPSQMMKIADIRPAITTETDQTLLTADFEPSMITADFYYPVVAECSHQPMLAPNSDLSEITAGSDQPGIFVNFVQPAFTTDSDRPAFTTDSDRPTIAANCGRPAIAVTSGQPAIAADSGQPAIDPDSGRRVIMAVSDQPGCMVVSDHPGHVAISDHPGLMAVSDHPGLMAVSDHPGLMAVSDHPGLMAVSDHPGFMAVSDHPGFMAVSDHPGLMAVSDHPGRMAVSDHPGLMAVSDHPGLMAVSDHPGLMAVSDHPGLMAVSDHPGS